MDKIAECFDLSFPPNKVVVVPNAVDKKSVCSASEGIEEKFLQYKGWIICVGRIEPRKNQLSLLKAIKDSDFHLLLVGKPSLNYKHYFKKVMSLAKRNPNVVYIQSIENSDLYSLYKVCKVCVLPSWFETPGLVSLEAAAMGCNIVVSPKGTTTDYFKNLAFYCDVQVENSILDAIKKAYLSPASKELQSLILEKYTWEEAAKATKKGYLLASGIL